MATRLDLGVADVHQPGALGGARPAKKGKAPLPPPKAKKRRRLTLAIRHPIHGRLDISLRDGEAVHACRLSVPLSAGSGDGPVWIQIAKVGEFRGHPAGPFALTPAVFADICRNFSEVDGGQVAFDFEHASELEPTDGSIPAEGAPAQGWIRHLDNRGLAGLWARVEWLEPARSYIREGKYRHVSPAIRFNAKHPETGKPIGARLTSVALTNKPFLRGMVPVMATDKTTPADGGDPVLLSAYSSHEYMPRLRACLKLGELATAAECGDALDRVYSMYTAAGDPCAMVQGVDLATYTKPLRDLMNLPLHHTWEEVFKAVRSLIEAAIAEHEVEHHSDDEELEPPSSRTGAEAPTMSDKNDESARLLRDLTTKHEEATRLLSEANARASKAESDLLAAGLEAKAKAAEAVSLSETVAALTAEVAGLKAERDQRLAADRAVEVDEVIATYGKAKGIQAEDRDALLSLLTASPESFRKLYPKIDPAKRTLMTEVAATRAAESQPAAVDGAAAVSVTLNLRDAVRALASAKGLSLEDAQNLILNGFNKGA